MECKVKSSNLERKVAKRCGPTRGTHSTPCWTRRLRRPPRNPLQNSLEQQIPLESSVVAETILIQVGLQILRAYGVIYAADSTLHKAPKALNGVGVDVALNVDASGMIDSAMDISVGFVETPIGRQFVGVDSGSWHDEFLCESLQAFLGYVVGDEGANALATAALYHSDYWAMELICAVRTSRMPTALSAHVGFIHLHRRALQLHVALRKKAANLPEHAPCSFVGDASLALNLFCGDAATSRAHEIHRVEPSLERSSALLEDGPGERVDVVSAVIASVGGAARDAIVLAVNAALLALGNAVRPAFLFDVLKAGVIVRKLGVKIRDCVAQLFWDALFGLHGNYRLPEGLLVVKG